MAQGRGLGPRYFRRSTGWTIAALRMAHGTQAQERRRRTLVLNDRMLCRVGHKGVLRPSSTGSGRWPSPPCGKARVVLKDIAFIRKDEITQAIALLIVTQARRLNINE